MDSENGVPLEDEQKGNFDGLSKEEGSMPEMNDVIHEQCSGGNEVCKDEIADKESINSSGPEMVMSKDVSESKTSDRGKASSSNGTKNRKSAKSNSNSKASVVFGCSTKPSLSQSLSFPTRGRHSDVMRRSIGVFPNKSNTGQSQKNNSKVESPRGNVSSNARNDAVSGRRQFASPKDVTNSAKATRRHTSEGSLPGFSRSVPGKDAATDGTEVKTAAPEELVEKKFEPGKTALSVEDEDVHSTTSSNLTPRTQQRIHVSAFSFRLDERAERRREFLLKIEEKVQAKEAEKNNLQVKSKENQEAEIKQLRKSLAFKATPMPSFYKEPPPKIELKKIPTTRPKSPKLGRNKGSSSAVGKSLENGGVVCSQLATEECKTPNSSPVNGEKDNAGLKKYIRRSLSKPHAKELSTARKPNRAEAGGEDNQTSTQSSEKLEPESHEKISPCSNSSYVVASPNLDTLPAEAAVKVDGHEPNLKKKIYETPSLL